jgi:hypothetical protein
MNKKWVACSWCHDSDEKVLFGVWEHRLLFQVSCLLGGQGFFFFFCACGLLINGWERGSGDDDTVAKKIRLGFFGVVGHS